MSKAPDISIIIVNYNTPHLTKLCIKSLKHAHQKRDKWEIILVDNGSEEACKDQLRKIKGITYIDLEKNVGFAAGNNEGIKRSCGKYILLLNSDTEVYDDSISSMITFMNDHPHAAAATCKLVLPGGEIDPACHRGFPTPWASFTYLIGLERLFPQSKLFSQYHLGYKNHQDIHQIDSPSGAFFLVRRDVIDEVGYLDDMFFMYAEDIDWSYRMHEKGYRIYFNPHVSVLHKKKKSGRSSKQMSLRRKTKRYFFETMKQFYSKHYRMRYGPVISFFVYAALDIRLFLIDTAGI